MAIAARSLFMCKVSSTRSQPMAIQWGRRAPSLLSFPKLRLCPIKCHIAKDEGDKGGNKNGAKDGHWNGAEDEAEAGPRKGDEAGQRNGAEEKWKWISKLALYVLGQVFEAYLTAVFTVLGGLVLAHVTKNQEATLELIGNGAMKYFFIFPKP